MVSSDLGVMYLQADMVIIVDTDCMNTDTHVVLIVGSDFDPKVVANRAILHSLWIFMVFRG